MQLIVRDANNAAQTIVVNGAAVAADNSGSITATGVSQVAIPASAARGGYYIQNNGINPMSVNELAADATLAGSFQLQPGQSFPPPGFPLSLVNVNIAGTIGDTYTARSW